MMVAAQRKDVTQARRTGTLHQELPRLMTNQDLVDLVRRIREGDRAAEGELVGCCSRGLMVALRQYVRNEDLAQDIHQETFEVVILRLRDRGIDDPAKIKRFIRQTAINKANGEFRTRDRHRTYTDTDLISRIADTKQGMLYEMTKEELLEIVKQLIAELPLARDRDILRRFYLFGEDRATICDVLELTYDHFDRVMYRARNRLRQMAK